MRKLIVLIVLCLITLSRSEAQSNTTNTPYYWYFDQNTGLNFKEYIVHKYIYNNSYHLLPKAITSTENKFDNSVYSSVATDSEGNILFYTDGATVYNQNNEISGKLNITPSSTGVYSNGMLTFILPISNREGYFYIIVNNAPLKTNVGVGSIYYAIYNANANGGKGGFESVDTDGYGVTNKLTGSIYIYDKNNIETGKLASPLGQTSGMTIISTPSKEYWLVNYLLGNIMAWKISDKGIDPTPVVSYVNKSSSFTNTSRDQYISSSLRFTPDGKKLLILERPQGNVTPTYKLDFDIHTDKASNLVTRNYGNVFIGQPSEIEILLNGKNIFLSVIGGISGWGLKVMDIDNFTVNAQYTNIAGTSLQLASDGRMYTSVSTSNIIQYIENHDEPDFTKIRINSLAYGDMGIGTSYLPILDAKGLGAKVITTCENSNATLSLSNDDPATITSINWNFGDGSSQLQTSIDTNNANFSVNHIYKTSGQYTVQALITHNTGATIIKTIVVNVEHCSTYSQLSAYAGYSVPVSTSLDISNLYSVVWDFGDGSETESQIINTSSVNFQVFTKNHKYNLAGQYLATIQGIQKDGSVTTTKVVVTVNDCTKTSHTTRCINEPVTLSVNKVPTTATQIKWDFNDGTTAVETINNTGFYSQTHSYTKPGTYTINIQALEADGTALRLKLQKLL